MRRAAFCWGSGFASVFEPFRSDLSLLFLFFLHSFSFFRVFFFFFFFSFFFFPSSSAAPIISRREFDLSSAGAAIPLTLSCALGERSGCAAVALNL